MHYIYTPRDLWSINIVNTIHGFPELSFLLKTFTVTKKYQTPLTEFKRKSLRTQFQRIKLFIRNVQHVEFLSLNSLDKLTFSRFNCDPLSVHDIAPITMIRPRTDITNTNIRNHIHTQYFISIGNITKSIYRCSTTHKGTYIFITESYKVLTLLPW